MTTRRTVGRAGHPPTRDAPAAAPKLQVSDPPYRRIAVYAFDPAASASNETADFARDVVLVPWAEAGDEPLRPGPCNEYLEVVDVDPESGLWYPPVDLEEPRLLARDGHPPSESNPQFHQQMAFAVAMRTIGQFERALGRRVLWAPRGRAVAGGDPRAAAWVRRLRIYPHALRQENAYYSPAKVAVLLGYYQAGERDTESVPGGWVFGCLSSDVIAHEVGHAVLDGINPRLLEDVDVDALAFHEGLADIVALLQHFTVHEAVAAEIARHGEWRLDLPSMLSGVARQFGRASGRRAIDLPPGPLRDAIARPEERQDETYREGHARGGRLLAAVYSAFLELYGRAGADLFAVAGPGAADPPLNPLIAGKLAGLAAKIAGRLLRMCLRALDLLPPTSATFTDFLRAAVTADADLYPADPGGYRRAVIGAFRRYGAIRQGLRTLAEEGVVWPPRPLLKLDPRYDGARAVDLDLEPLFGREAIYRQSWRNADELKAWLLAQPDLCGELGLLVDAQAPPSVHRPPGAGRGAPPEIEVHGVRMSTKVSEGGRHLRQMVMFATQARDAYFSAELQGRVDRGEVPPPHPDFVLRGGATVVFDLRLRRDAPLHERIRYVVRQQINDERLEAVRDYRAGRAARGVGLAYVAPGETPVEPLALVHSTRRAAGG